MASENGTSSPEQRIRSLYERAERDAAAAAERIVGRSGFVHGLALLTDNAVALTRIGNEALDLLIRNARLAGRGDLRHLAAQMGRTEDKLERVLQEVEALRDEVAALAAADAADPERASDAGRSVDAGRAGGATTRRAGGSGGGRGRSAGGAAGRRAGGGA